MKITTRQNSVECAEYNKANADAIAMGLLEELAPSAEVLAREAKDAEEKAKGVVRVTNKVALLQRIWNCLPANVRAVYTVPTVEQASRSYNGVSFQTVGYYWDAVELESYSRSSGYRYHSDHAYYRIVVGSYGDKSILKLNADLTITPAQMTKVVAKICERYDVRIAKANMEKAKQTDAQRREAWLKDEANNKLAQTILKTGYVSGSDKLSVGEDGLVTMGYQTLTVEQWKKVALLMACHATEMKNLYKSFEVTPSATAEQLAHLKTA